ncbi:MAG TPA: hypothetical protein GX513_10610 [Firmicutes bacterium]|nr:hypothetical protein [Bacillota bacterium]
MQGGSRGGGSSPGNLDTRRGAEILDLFEQLNNAGRTIVMVTHDPAAASRAGRVLRLRDGVLEDGGEVRP